MLRIILIAALAIAPTAALAKGGSHSVSAHVTRSGTYVASHRATNPDSSRTNNWSSAPNVNPYTGKAGTKKPYAPKPLR